MGASSRQDSPLFGLLSGVPFQRVRSQLHAEPSRGLEWQASSPSRTYQLQVATTQASTTIPDLSALGLAVPGVTRVSWQVSGYAPYSSVDTALSGLDASGLPVNVDELRYTSTPSREFTTADSP